MAKSKIYRSQMAHARLRNLYKKRGNNTKNKLYACYHDTCIKHQELKGRVLSRSERRKLFLYYFDNLWNK